MATVYVNIGSNMGERKKWISKALDCIGEIFGYYCVSGFVESEPWGFDSTNHFINIGAAFRSDMHPELILMKLQEIERTLSGVGHRDEAGNYKDREVDIDIMAIDQTRYRSESLRIPHPHLREREFFLMPLMELCPHWQYPEANG